MTPRRSLSCLPLLLCALALPAGGQAHTLTPREWAALERTAQFLRDRGEGQKAEQVLRDARAGRVVFQPLDPGTNGLTDAGRYPVVLASALVDKFDPRDNPRAEANGFVAAADLAATLDHEYVHVGQDAAAFVASSVRHRAGGDHPGEQEGWRAGFEGYERWARHLEARLADSRLRLAERLRLAAQLEAVCQLWQEYAGSYAAGRFGELVFRDDVGDRATLAEKQADIRALQERAGRMRRQAADTLGYDGLYRLSSSLVPDSDEYCAALAAGCVAELSQVEVKGTNVLHRGHAVGSFDPASGRASFQLGQARFVGAFRQDWDDAEKRYASWRLQGRWSCPGLGERPFSGWRRLDEASPDPNRPCGTNSIASTSKPAPRPTPRATPKPTPAPTPRPTPAAQAWVLADARAVVEGPKKDDACYFGHSLSVTTGGGGAGYSWTDVNCVGGSKCSGSVKFSGAWTPPPALTPGGGAELAVQLTTSASQQCGNRGTSHWASLRVDGALVDECNASGDTSRLPPPRSCALKFRVPATRSSPLQLLLRYATNAGGGGVTFTYVAGAAPAPAPSQLVRVGGSVEAPRKLRHVEPQYPDLARQARVEGLVVLECEISPEGRVTRADVLRGAPLLDEAAREAVLQWAYEPTLLAGQPVPLLMTVTVAFSLSER